MAVKIRFARIGKKHAPVYRIVAVDSRKKRDGKYLENLGTYNPLTKEIIQFHDDRVTYWISVGAIVADSVQRLMKVRKKQLGTKVEAPAPKKAAAPKKDKAVEKPKAPAKKAAKPAEVKEVKKAPVKKEAKKAAESKTK